MSTPRPTGRVLGLTIHTRLHVAVPADVDARAPSVRLWPAGVALKADGWPVHVADTVSLKRVTQDQLRGCLACGTARYYEPAEVAAEVSAGPAPVGAGLRREVRHAA